MTTKPLFLNGREITPTDATFETFDYPTADLKGWRIREDEQGLHAINPSGPIVLRLEQEEIVVTTAELRYVIPFPLLVLDELVRRQRERVAEALGRESGK